MNTPSEVTTFKGSEDARNFFYLYENVVTKSLPDSRFNLENAPTEEAKDYVLVKKVMMEKF